MVFDSPSTARALVCCCPTVDACAVLAWAMLLAVSAPGLERGTYEPPAAPLPRALTTGSSRQSLVVEDNNIVTIEGDTELVSGVPGQWGLRFDPDENDLADLTRELVAAGFDRNATLLLFTTFEDLGSGGPAYYVPLLRTAEGLGRDPLDQRDAFGVSRLSGIANIKRPADHGDQLVQIILHELAHPFVAYLMAGPAMGSTLTPTLLGRQEAHWHAALQTQASFLGGHDFVQTSTGDVFVVAQRETTFSSLDLYAMGLLPPNEVGGFYFLEDLRNERGFAIPGEARLNTGDVVSGRRRDITIDDVVAASGVRNPAFGDAPAQQNIQLAILTEPGESASSTRAVALAAEIEILAENVSAAWSAATRGRGRLCFAPDGCPANDGGVDAGLDVGPDNGVNDEPDLGAVGIDAGAMDQQSGDAETVPHDDGCGCRTSRRDIASTSQAADKKKRPPALVLVGLLALGGRRLRQKAR